jgi:hypothetical protein
MTRPRAEDLLRELVGSVARDIIGPIVRDVVVAVLDERLPVQRSRSPVVVAGATRPPPSEKDPNYYVSREGAAEITGYSVSTVARAIKDGRLKAVGLRKDKIARYEVDKFMAEAGGKKPEPDDDKVNRIVDRLLDD